MGEQLRKLLADQLAVIHHEDASIHGALIRVEVGGLILVELLGKRCFARASRRGFNRDPCALTVCIVDYARFRSFVKDRPDPTSSTAVIESRNDRGS